MKPQALLSAAALLPAFVTAAPADKQAAAAKPPAFFLAGDSTTAVQSTGGGGWGNGFLSFLKKPAFGTNYGRNGRTTVDYVSQGHWDTVKSAVKANTANFDVYVTIQVG
ncbi:GDSL-like lipase/acylhydrolase [Colletotrichum tofieldiae]|nr:GDSL-like lipase/acylhydrolase [Colletotrichum tofieldiae]